MIASLRAPVAVLGVCVALGAAAAVLHARETRFPLPPSPARLMYLRSGRTAGRLFLSFDALAADVYWIRTIQHYGRDLHSGLSRERFELLQPLLDLTTTLDPHFNVAYRFGAIFLAEPPPKGPGRPDQAIALLEKGLGKNPSRWQYAHDIGFVHYWYTGNYVEASRWFARAAALPGAPEWIRPLAALTLAQGGDRASARNMLTELLNADQGYVRAAAERGLMQLQAVEGIEQLRGLIERYRTVTGTFPREWRDLVKVGLLPGLPADPSRAPFAYDADTHDVTLAPDSSLAPLPPFLQVKR